MEKIDFQVHINYRQGSDSERINRQFDSHSVWTTLTLEN